MHRTENSTDTTVQLTPAVILRGAARYLELHGWTQDDYYDESAQQKSNDSSPKAAPFPPACVVGAIGMAAFGRRAEGISCDSDKQGVRDAKLAIDTFCDYLHLYDDDSTGDQDPYAWNDRTNRTADQVVATLRAAADDWDRMHGGTR